MRIDRVGRARYNCWVSFQVSVKMILADILYDLEAVPAVQVTDHTQQEKGPMLC